jgi:Phage phiEco32-like COOH.NH2 ligase-type 2
MTRHDFLKAVLKGEPPEVTSKREEVLLKWATTLDPLSSPSVYTPLGRRLNNFCVGSDPEFSFRNLDGERVTAVECGLKVGLAAGADQNERLVELRPWPSPSVVEHVAGIMSALRWMFRVYNRRATMFSWRAGAWFAGDGMGGHVHFGRKRPTRVEEVAALDGLARVFKASGLFPVKEWDRRMRGDNYHNAPYGLPGDFRVQRHGYEYRSLPSWLQSPTVAFIVLTASKLAVLDPSITVKWSEKVTAVQARNLLRGLAKLYKGRDDDAYILYHILTQSGDLPFDFDYEVNFATTWGIPFGETIAGDENIILPACIQPQAEEVLEMQNHLLFGIPLRFARLAPNFIHKLPEGNYTWLPRVVAGNRRSGFGDLIHNLVVNEDLQVYWDYTTSGEFKINGSLPLMWTPAEKQMFRRYHSMSCIMTKNATKETGTVITVPKQLCQTHTIAGLRAMLLHSGLFPVWTVDTVQKDSLATWLASRKHIAQTRNWRTH